jgi:hypothetical protein
VVKLERKRPSQHIQDIFNAPTIILFALSPERPVLAGALKMGTVWAGLATVSQDTMVMIARKPSALQDCSITLLLELVFRLVQVDTTKTLTTLPVINAPVLVSSATVSLPYALAVFQLQITLNISIMETAALLANRVLTRMALTARIAIQMFLTALLAI